MRELGYVSHDDETDGCLYQMATGLFQATGWPAVVAIVAQWFGKDHLGLVMGIWNAHASVGNSVGSAMSASVVHYGWGSSFLLLGSFIAATGFLLWFFIVPQPIDAGYGNPIRREARDQHTSRTTDSLTHSSVTNNNSTAEILSVAVGGSRPF